MPSEANMAYQKELNAFYRAFLDFAEGTPHAEFYHYRNRDHTLMDEVGGLNISQDGAYRLDADGFRLPLFDTSRLYVFKEMQIFLAIWGMDYDFDIGTLSVFRSYRRQDAEPTI